MLEKILKKVSEHTNVPADDILSKKRDAKTSEAKQIFMYLAYMYGETQQGIADFMHCTRSNITIQVGEFNYRADRYVSLKNTVNDLKDAISNCI